MVSTGLVALNHTCRWPASHTHDVATHSHAQVATHTYDVATHSHAQVGNDRSANYGNGMYQGLPVNHQYDKVGGCLGGIMTVPGSNCEPPV